MRLAVVGAGWAGLAAAATLKTKGAHVTVFEASSVPGGRAKRVDDLNLGAIDNGQHLLLGAYTETLALIKQLHPRRGVDQSFHRTSLHIESADGSFRLKTPHLFAPMHTICGLLNATGLSWQDRWHAMRMIICLKRAKWQAPADLTVEQLLKQYRQSARLERQLWTPLCLASLNTANHQASAQLF